MPPAKRKPQKTPTPREKLAEAAQYEDAIRESAEQVRGDAKTLTAELFMQLYPLLRQPIHEGHIEHVSAGEGKPYDSTGVRSVQVQHDRMNNVLTPLWWNEVVEYHENGTLCHVTIGISGLVERESWGGVDRGSTKGNVYKGSYTNAAKVAFARIGPGHEIYVGEVDLDPDVSESAAAAQAKPEQLPAVQTISAKDAAKLRDRFDQLHADFGEVDSGESFVNDFKVKLGTMGVAGVKSVDQAISKLTPAQAKELDEWFKNPVGSSNGA